MRDEAEISSKLTGFSTSNISVIDPAEIPRSPITPNKKRNLLLGLLVGLCGGVGFCFLLEYLDNTIKSPEDVEKLAELPSLGVVPYLPPEGMEIKKRYGYFKKLSSEYRVYGEEDRGNEEASENVKEIELVNFLFPRFFISEDYRTIRTSILLSHAVSPPKSIVITSALPSEGKTTTVANLAVAFSQISKKVLMLDTDLRKPRLHEIFKVKNVGGLTGFLTGKINLEDALKMTAVDNVWILPSGPIPPNPAELINSDKMKEMLDRVKNHFDIVLLDSSPLLAAIDTVVLSTFVEAAVLVIRAGETTKKAFLQSYEVMQKARANVLGAVLNEVKLNQGRYYYKEYYRGREYHPDE
jgi:capsular exopolysaccharide synthesis family protein